ncbi:TPA: autotransporter outer membrane beta-barrel domain-containing protein [Enterobacter bugandensis]|uniref:autotransporter outer membrane beta-barrel domain-containing protein n=1 Tax=Enterobacter bugandensis TaxID=881260 RepID=UPI001A91F9AA|nr:autotransporter outer membrane beta-barrel domain-containing protein [Enterobacter bugandensis]MBO0404960.1 autotransporter outer membrane beta-barrel domain-containing protein [Enterobacter bugandensis]HED1246679.1 autotransporter outer membrane beta-barrel domain-containing protein [Enterobacter bugandensis]
MKKIQQVSFFRLTAISSAVVSTLVSTAYANCNYVDVNNVLCTGPTVANQTIIDENLKDVVIDESFDGTPSSLFFSNTAMSIGGIAVTSNGSTAVTAPPSNDSTLDVALSVVNRGTGDANFIQENGTLSSNVAGAFVAQLGQGGINVLQNNGSLVGDANGLFTLKLDTSNTTNIELHGNLTGGDAASGTYTPDGGVSYVVEPAGLNVISRGGAVNVNQISGNIEGARGILINQAEGEVNLLLSSVVYGRTYDGATINSGAVNESSKINVIQNSGQIIGEQNGLFVNTLLDSASPILIDISGAVKGNQNAGVVASHSGMSSTGDIIFSENKQGEVSGKNYGILATNTGTGKNEINISGKVISNGTDAINETISKSSSQTFTTEGNLETTVVKTSQVVSNVDGGTAINIDTPVGTDVVVNLNEGADVYSASGIAIRDGAGNTTLSLNDGSKIAGEVVLGAGDDTVNINGNADVKGLTLLDGGSSKYLKTQEEEIVTNVLDTDTFDSWTTTETNSYIQNDVLGTSNAGTNKLNLTGTMQDFAGSVIRNWQSITLDNSVLSFVSDGDLLTGSGANSDGTKRGLIIKNNSRLISPVLLGIEGDVTIDETSSLIHNQGGEIKGNVINSGLIQWNGVGNELIINGDYTGREGSVLSLNTKLEGDNSLTDSLIVRGNTSGETGVIVNNAGGIGAKTLNGIRIISVEGLSEGVFSQKGRIVAGAYDYTLVKGNGQDTKNWYLTNEDITGPGPGPDPDPGTGPGPNPGPDPDPGTGPGPNPGPDPEPGIGPGPQPETPVKVRPEAASYLDNLSAANTMFNLTMADRTGEKEFLDEFNSQKHSTSLWLRQSGTHYRWKDNSATLKTQSNRYVVQLGGDLFSWSNSVNERLYVGIMAGYGHQASNSGSSVTGYSSKGTTEGYNTGLYALWSSTDESGQGAYIDSWLQYNWYTHSVKGEDIAPEKYNSSGFVGSVETGYDYLIDRTIGSKGSEYSVFVRPQLQAIWSGIDTDDHRESNGSKIKSTGKGNVQTRAGVRIYLKGSSNIDANTGRVFEPFIEANWVHNTKSYEVSMNGVPVQQAGTKNIGEIKIGVDSKLTNEINLWGHVAQDVGDKGYSSSSAMVGVRYSF